MIAAARRAITEGLESASLRELAEAPLTTRNRRALLLRALDELSIPRPDPRVPGQVVEGTPYARLPTDTLHLEIVDGELGPEVVIRVNDELITEEVDGMGMHPFDLLVPANLLAAAGRVVIGRCSCGSAGCGSTEAEVSRVDGVVHWDWSGDAPMEHGVSFDAAQYDVEVERLGNDQGWERTVDIGEVDIAGLELSWAGVDYRDPRKLLVALHADEEQFHIFLRFPIDADPDDVRRTLRQPPRSWQATYHSLVVGRRGRPSMAGWRWRSEDAWG
ncbi:hypothetical protein [Kribbella jejuensis]|uniref:hypothetical protein n=1 Tax=Kribbella jejuensis TaxID=236068 RepID=UPI001151F7F1|nr:hypothetical protein [Kribbella jejuensis]